MSTLEVSNISDGTDTVETGYVVNGSAKAWCNYTPPSATIQDSLNVASLVDNGVGDTTVNYTASMGSANYVHSEEATRPSASVPVADITCRLREQGGRTASSIRINVGDSDTVKNFTLTDYWTNAVMSVTGDLA